MVGHPLRGLKRTFRKSRGVSLARRRRGMHPWLVEGLEDRLLLSGNPTIYTVNSTGNGTTGTGDSGTLPYVIGQANANTNTAGSEIQFDPTVFASPQTITLASTLVLSETAGPEVIDGPGASLVTVSGGNAVEVFSVDERRDGHPLRPDHLGRQCRQRRRHRQRWHADASPTAPSPTTWPATKAAAAASTTAAR